MNTMADTNPIKIFKGDDTDFNGGKWLTINLTTDLDLTGFIGVFTLDKFKVTKSAASKSIDLVIPRSFTSKMAVGEYAGVFQLIDTNGRYLTVTNTLPFQVTQEVFTPQGDEINLQVPENYPVEISLSIYGGAVDYDKLANLPTFNGKEWKGPLTFASENIAPKSELDTLAGKVNTNKNDIDGLGDQIHEVEAKIPQAASDSNQLVDKASMTSAIAAVQKGIDDNAGDITALQADLAGKQDKGDYATNTALTAGLQTKQNAFTVGDGLKMEDNVLSATGGGGSTPDNMVTTNTYQDITARKTFTEQIDFTSNARVSSLYSTTNQRIAGSSSGTMQFSSYDQKTEMQASDFNINTVNPNSGGRGPATLNGKQIATTDDITAAVAKVSGGGKSTDDGIKGDYCSTYGILAAPNGVLTANGMKLTLKAGLVLQCAGQEAKTTIASDTVHEVESTQDFDFFYADGAFYEATQVVYSRTEPEDGATGILAWWNPDVKKWQFKSNAAGNVWATADKAARLAHIHTDGTSITRIDYIGTRVLDEGRLLQGLKKTVTDLATGADSAAIIAKVNEIWAALREAGVLS